MFGAYDHVGAAVVLADDGVPQGFARTGHAHGQRQQRQHGEVVREVPADGLVAVHARVVLQIARLGHAHGGVQQDVALDVLGGLQGDLALQAVHGLAGLEGHHAAPAHLLEQGAHFLGGIPEALEIIVVRQLDTLDAATDIDGVHTFVQVAHAGVLLGGGVVDLFRFAAFVRPVDVFHGEHRGHEAFSVTKSDFRTFFQLFSEIFRNIEHDRNRPDGAVSQPHVVHDRVVIGLVHESGQWRESAIHQ